METFRQKRFFYGFVKHLYFYEWMLGGGGVITIAKKYISNYAIVCEVVVRCVSKATLSHNPLLVKMTQKQPFIGKRQKYKAKKDFVQCGLSDSGQVFLLYSVKLKKVSVVYQKTLLHYIPKHNVAIFTALYFINKSCCLFYLKNIKNVVLSCTQVNLWITFTWVNVRK